MRRHRSHQNMEKSLTFFRNNKQHYVKLESFLLQFNLKVCRFYEAKDACYFYTNQGWFRFSLISYEKQELLWLKSILEYLEAASFDNWATAWQKSIILEEMRTAYFIQPWFFPEEPFSVSDPASLARAAEIIANFHATSKGFLMECALELKRDRWNDFEKNLDEKLQLINDLELKVYSEKHQKSILEFKNLLLELLKGIKKEWQSLEMNAFLENQLNSGMLTHGAFRPAHLVLQQNNYYLLNWEAIAFRPRVADLADFIGQVNWWEPEWLLFFLGEYFKRQPLCPEEYKAFHILLRFPWEVFAFLEKLLPDKLERKHVKELLKMLSRKNHCLEQMVQEFDAQKRWLWGKVNTPVIPKNGTELTSVESWGGFTKAEKPSHVTVDERVNGAEAERSLEADQQSEAIVLEITENIENFIKEEVDFTMEDNTRTLANNSNNQKITSQIHWKEFPK